MWSSLAVAESACQPLHAASGMRALGLSSNEGRAECNVMPRCFTGCEQAPWSQGPRNMNICCQDLPAKAIMEGIMQLLFRADYATTWVM